jgi:superfamily I DNA/RNA helicase
MSNPLVAISIELLTAFAAVPRQKQGKVIEFFNKFRNNPSSKAIKYEKISNGKDENIYSVPIDDTYRGIVVRHEESGVYMLLWVDYHDEAYEWARKKKCTINKVTGSVQVFDIPDVIIQQKVSAEKESLFKNVMDEQLALMGVPEEQIELVRSIQSLETLYQNKKVFPEDAYEGLEWIANGFEAEEIIDNFFIDREIETVNEEDYAEALQNASSQKSFIVVDGEEELKKIMSEPLEKWRIFLHPTQRKIVSKKYSGPARVLGGAGTGKTVVAMHRAKQLASNMENDERLLFTTFTSNLAGDIKDNLRKICTTSEMKHIQVVNLDAWVYRFLREHGYEYQIVYDTEIEKAWEEAITYADNGLEFLAPFYQDEWIKIVQAQEAYTKEQYLKASRLGRGVRLDRKKRMQVWHVFEEYQNIMNEKQYRDTEYAMYECRKILEHRYKEGQYQSIIVDEGQDFSMSAFRLIRALAGKEHENDIFVVGDAHQRIYKNKAVLSQCGVNIRGRSNYLRINYRTTEETRKYAFSLLKGISFDDLDENYDNGKEFQALTHGLKPELEEFSSAEKELEFIIEKINNLEEVGVDYKNICIVTRTHKLLDTYIAGLSRAGIRSYEIKKNKVDDRSFEGIRMATMHRVKGLEFEHVFIAAVNKRIIPLYDISDAEDRVSAEEIRTSEKCLLYVALTRARHAAYISGYGALSELIV